MDAADPAYDARIADPQIRQFVEYWRARRGAAQYPARAALDPVDFHYVLGDVVLIEVGKAPPDSPFPWHFRYRLIGSNVSARDGYDLTNKTLEDLPEPEYRERIRTTWSEVCDSGRPAHYLRQLFLDRRLRCYEVVVMPLASNGRDIDMLVSVQRETPLEQTAGSIG
ncbi:MAG TPA: PAS domain-containing protein [Stellaceae bacterium]|nr:PAS domain-containing protein [Stellaceae bacterium]